MQSDSTEAFENKLKHLKDFLSLNQGQKDTPDLAKDDENKELKFNHACLSTDPAQEFKNAKWIVVT